MPRNGSGVYSPPSANYPAVSGTLIESADRNAIDADIATAITNSIAVNGESVVTNNIPFGGNKLTGVAPATVRTDVMTLANVQDGTGLYVATVGGTADVITISPNPSIPAYVAGQEFSFIASGANTTNVTINVSGLGAKAITKNGTTALVAGDIPSGFLVSIRYDGTRFQLVGSTSTAFNGGTVTNPVSVPDDAYAVGWNGSAQVPTKNAIYDKIESILDGQTFTGDIIVPDEAYGVGWNGSLEVPTKNAVYDKIEALPAGTSFSSNNTTTGGTTIEFTGAIPSTANEFTISFKGFSTNGASPFILQVGVGGVYVTTGYEGWGANMAGAAISGASVTTGFPLGNVPTAAASYAGYVTFRKASGNIWNAVGGLGSGGGVALHGWGGIDAGGVLDSIRWTTTGGANTVDANGGVIVSWRA